MRIKVRKKLDPYPDEGKIAEEFFMINTDGIHAICIDKGGGLNYIPFKDLYVIDGYYLPGSNQAGAIDFSDPDALRKAGANTELWTYEG